MPILRIPRTASEFYMAAGMLFFAAFLGGMASCAITEGCKLKPLKDSIPLVVVIAVCSFVLLWILTKVAVWLAKIEKKVV